MINMVSCWLLQFYAYNKNIKIERIKMMNISEDNKNYYYFGNPSLKEEETLNRFGFSYLRDEFDEFGNTYEIWILDKEE